MSCFAVARTDIVGRKGLVPLATPAGYGPTDLQAAYAQPSAGGSGQVVAIVDAFDNPNAEADLAIYRAQYGLPPCTTANGCFRKVNQDGQPSPLPAPDAGWAAEISLDLDMVSAVCPNCDLLLVEATSNQLTDLGTAVNRAVTMGAKFVSNSYGGSEYAEQVTEGDPFFDHPGVAITVSSGDSGYGVSYPASSPKVTAVGGTSLNRDGSPRGFNETVWAGAGSGCSAYEEKPSFQTDAECARRTVADVSAVADPATGVAVYNSYQAPGWAVYGGTSASAPIVAASYALAGNPGTADYPNSYPYASASALYDVTAGSNGTCGGSYLCTAKPGYDGPTGLGTPNGVRAFGPPGPHGVITGKVTDAANGHPVAGATVTAGTATDTTDAAGQYQLGVPVGTYDVKVAAYGFASKTVPGVTVADGATVTADVALASVPKAAVSGLIRDGSGHGWPLYAKISVDGVPGGPVFTDPATGRYQFDLPTGSDYTLHVSAVYPGYQGKDETITVGSGGVTKDLTLPVTTEPCTAAGYASKSTGLTETFDGTTVPTGWSVVNNTADGGWTFTDDGGRGNLTGGSGGFAIIDSDFLGANKTQDTSLITPVVDLSGHQAPVISFASDYRSFSGSIADVDLSLDAGATWTNVLHQEASVRGPRTEYLPIPQAAGVKTAQVRFHFTGTWAYWWEVDNVLVGTRSCEAIPGGLVLGQVTDANTGGAVAGATVVSVDQPADTAVSTATPDDPNLGDGFYWMFSSLTGAHPFKASHGGYATQSKTVTVAPNWATTANYSLAAGRIVTNKSEITKTVKFGESTTATFKVTNTGGAPANVKLGERDKGFTLLKAAGVGAPLQQVKGIFDPHRMVGHLMKPGSPNAAEARQVRPSTAPSAAPWTDIATYPTVIMDNLVGYNDGKLYSVGGVDAGDLVTGAYVFDPETGAWTAIAAPPTAREKPNGAFVDGKLYVFGGWGSTGAPINTLEIYNPTTNSWSTGAPVPRPYAASSVAVLGGKLYSIGGCDSSACGKTDVQVYDPVANSWSTVAAYPEPISWQGCGGIGDQVYCGGGTSDAGSTKKGYTFSPGTGAWSPIADLPIDLWAMGSAAANGVLLLSGGVTNGNSTVTNQGYAYDPTSNAWAAIANSNNAVYRGGSACGFYKVGGSVGGFNAVNSAEVLPGLDECGGGADVTWLSESPATFTLQPGRSTTVTLTLDSSGAAQPGSFAADVTLKADTPYAVAPVAVTMNVTPPKSWGKIAGQVTGTDCSGNTAPVAGATVQIDTWATHYTLRTDAEGRYALWLDKRNNPLSVIVAKDGWQPQTRTVKITAGKTTTVDWKLKTAQAC